MAAITILLLAANPMNTPPLRLEEEIRAIDRELYGAAYRDQIDFRPHLATRMDDLQGLLLRYRPTVVHFAGHGIESGAILLQDDARRAHVVTAPVLARLFSQFREDIRCVLLNACFSQTQAQALTESVDVVVGMKGTVADQTSTTFAAAFYRALGYGRTFQSAFDLACNQLALESGDWETPILLARPGFDPAKVSLLPATPTWPSRVASVLPDERSVTQALRRPEIDLPDALRRLAALTAEQAPAPLPFGSWIPFSPNPLFIGRDAELQEVARTLVRANTHPTIALSGMAGVGKTQLAVECAHRFGPYFAGGVFWLSFAQGDAVAAEFARCGGPSGLDLPGLCDLSFDDQVERVRAVFNEPLPRLLIFDDCEVEELLARWRPTTGGARVIITCRRAAWPASLGIHTIQLKPLERSASTALLRQARPAVTSDDATWGEIAATLGGLPLALHMAGSFLDRYRAVVTPEAYLARLQTANPVLHRSLTADKHSPTAHVQSVALTFQASYQGLDMTDRIDTLAQRLLLRLGHLMPGAPVPIQLLLICAEIVAEDEQLSAVDALHRLATLGLATVESPADAVLHPLVAAFVEQLLDAPASRLAVEQALAAEVGFRNEQRSPLPIASWLPHMRHVADRAVALGDAPAGDLCQELGTALHDGGDFSGALGYLERALALRRQQFGESHPKTAQSMSSLGNALKDKGDPALAQPYLEQALEIRRQSLGDDHVDTAESLNNLGEFLRGVGDLAAAQDYLAAALATTRRLLGNEHPTTCIVLNNLGMVCLDLQDLDCAQGYLSQALATRRRVLGDTHPDTAASYNNLGSLCNANGDHVGAIDCFARALEIWRAASGDEHPHTALAYHNLGRAYQANGDLGQASPLLERSLVLYRRIYGDDHPETALTFNNVGLLRLALGDDAGARACFRSAHRVLSQLLPPDHPLVAALEAHLSVA